MDVGDGRWDDVDAASHDIVSWFGHDDIIPLELLKLYQYQSHLHKHKTSTSTSIWHTCRKWHSTLLFERGLPCPP